MSEFIRDYYIFVFVAALGAIQVGAAAGKLDGLLAFKRKAAALAFGGALMAGAAAWFFSTGERNINDYAGGITANGQALYAFLGCITAVVATFAATSLLNLRIGRGAAPPFDGLHSLREANYLLAVSANLRYWTKAWRKLLTRRFFFG